MSQDKEIIFGNSRNYNRDDKNLSHVKQEQITKRNKIKSKLKLEYNLNDDEAEEILTRIENRFVDDAKNSRNISQNVQTQPEDVNIPLHNFNKEVKPHSEFNNSQSDIYDVSKKSFKNGDDNLNESQSVNKEGVGEKNADLEHDKQNVDSILSDIVENFHEEISIELKNVNLTFDLIDDKADTLKEAFIRTIKNNRPKKTKFHVLNDINFKIYKGEKVGIVGYNGAGKSTLLKVIAGIYPPDNGEVVTNGNISPLLSLGAGFDRNYSGRKNIYLNGAVLGYDKEFLKGKEEEIIEFSELGEFIDYPIKNYSSGMLAKLGFSIATVLNPDILIIDEILGVGDVTFRRKSGDKIKSLMDGKTTVLLVSHALSQIRKLCDKAIWIDNGRVREIGDVNEVCNHYIKDSEKASNEQLANIQLE